MSNFGADIFDQEPDATGSNRAKSAKDMIDRDSDAAPAGTDKQVTRRSGRKRVASQTPEPEQTAGESAQETTKAPKADRDRQPGPPDPQPPDEVPATADGGDGQHAEPIDQPAARGRRRPAPPARPAAAGTDRKPTRRRRTGPDHPSRGDRSNRDDRQAEGPRRRRSRSSGAAARPAEQPASGLDTERIGVLIDLAALQEQARELGGELAFRKLLKAIANNRTLFAAVCYVVDDETAAAHGPPPTSALAVQRHPDAQTAAVAMTVDAMEMAGNIDTVVLAPMPPTLRPLLAALAARGVRVEVASFSGRAPSDTEPRPLGNNCLFVP